MSNKCQRQFTEDRPRVGCVVRSTDQATDPSLPRQIALKVVSAERSRRKYDPVVWLGDKLFRR